MWQIAYVAISGYMNWRFDYADPLEYLVGTMVVAMVGIFIDTFILKKAWRWTGSLKRMDFIGKDQMSDTHWFLRTMLLGIFIIISITPLGKILINPLTHYFYALISGILTDMYKSVFDVLLNSNT